MARRNIVWRAWNGEIASLPDSPDKAMAAALGLMLGRDVDVRSRNRGMAMYQQKAIAYLSRDDIQAIQAGLEDGSPPRIADALARLAAADHRAAELIRMVLADRERVARYISGTPIPLETLPDGTAP
jgi:hypothetical protein